MFRFYCFIWKSNRMNHPVFVQSQWIVIVLYTFVIFISCYVCNLNIILAIDIRHRQCRFDTNCVSTALNHDTVNQCHLYVETGTSFYKMIICVAKIFIWSGYNWHKDVAGNVLSNLKNIYQHLLQVYLFIFVLIQKWWLFLLLPFQKKKKIYKQVI